MNRREEDGVGNDDNGSPGNSVTARPTGGDVKKKLTLDVSCSTCVAISKS